MTMRDVHTMLVPWYCYTAATLWVSPMVICYIVHSWSYNYIDDAGHKWGTWDQRFGSSQTVGLQVPHSWQVSFLTFDWGYGSFEQGTQTCAVSCYKYGFGSTIVLFQRNGNLLCCFQGEESWDFPWRQREGPRWSCHKHKSLYTQQPCVLCSFNIWIFFIIELRSNSLHPSSTSSLLLPSDNRKITDPQIT